MHVLFKKELKSYFRGPMAYIFLTVFLFFTGLYFVSYNLLYNNSSFNFVLYDLVIIFLFMVPIFTMRLLSEEKKNKTDQLLFTSPQSISSIVCGKYFAAVALFLIGTLCTIIYPIILSFFGSISLSELTSSYLGFILLGSSLISLGLFISSLTENQIASAVTTLGALLVIWFLDPISSMLPQDSTSGLIFIMVLIAVVGLLIFKSTKNYVISISITVISSIGSVILFFINKIWFEGIITNVLQWFSLISKNQNFAQGIISLNYVFYYLSFIFVMIFLTIKTIEKRRWS